MNELLKNTFDNEAEQYDETTQYLLLDYNFILEQVVKKIDFSNDEQFYILDLGCGTGNLIKKIRKNYPKAIIYALDFSDEMLEQAQRKGIIDVKYINGNMFKLNDISLPYFDVVVSSFVFHNFHNKEEYVSVFNMVNEHLAINGKFIIADLIELEDPFQKKDIKRRLIKLMRQHGLSDEEIAKWLGILEVEDSPLPIASEIKLLKDTGFEIVNASTYDSDIAIFTSYKKLNLVQLKSELLFQGVKQNDFVKQLYLSQNPQNVWKTGNNGIFLSVNGLEILVGINHKSNHESPFEIFVTESNTISLKKNENILNVNIMPMEFPEWFFTKIPELGDKYFSEYFVYEGEGYLHLAYTRCSFSHTEKCKFCSTKRRMRKNENNIEEVCVALSKVLLKMPDDIQICLGGGTYIPFEYNVEYFSKIIKCIRKYNTKIPIWVEIIPPEIDDIERLINDGATSFGFNLEIWDEEIRSKICPGKSQVSKEHYIKACKYVLKKLGPNSVGSCIIVGLDSYESIKTAIDSFIIEGIQPCILPYKVYNRTDLGDYKIPYSYKYDFYRLSEYASNEAKKNGMIFNKYQGCLKCSCCTIMHDLQDL